MNNLPGLGNYNGLKLRRFKYLRIGLIIRKKLEKRNENFGGIEEGVFIEVSC